MITDITHVSDKDLSRIASLLGDRVTQNEPLAQYTTYRVGGAASLFMRVLTVEDLHSLSRALSKVKVPVVVIGRGSNMLVSDRGFRGIAVTLGPFAELINLPTVGGSPIVIAGAMAPLPVLARQSVHHGLTGLEWAVGVPGAIGGAVRMNAGGHGADMIASLLSGIGITVIRFSRLLSQIFLAKNSMLNGDGSKATTCMSRLIPA